MPLNTDSIIQSNTGGFDAASGTVSLGVATTAGNHVVICAMHTGPGGTAHALDIPTGFSWGSNALTSTTMATTPYVWYKTTSGGETEWTLEFITGGPEQVLWSVFEVEGLDQSAPLHVATGINPFNDAGEVTTRSTSTAPATSSYDVLGFAVFPARSPSTTVAGWSGYTNNWTEVAQVSRDDGSNAVSLAVAVRPSQALGQHECTASLSTAALTRATLVVFTAQDARWAVTPDILTGFEFGTTTTLTNTSIATGETLSPVFNAVVGAPAVTTSTPRTGTYCLELSSTAAAECVTWTNPGCLSEYGPFGSGGAASVWEGPWVDRLHIRFPTSLPSADLPLASIEAGSLANGVIVWYRSASQKIGVQVGTGTEVLSDATVSADTWIGIDRRYDCRVANHTFDWQVDYDSEDATAPVAQTQAVGASTSAATISTVRYGWSDSRTGTVRYDDIIGSKVWNNYPIGNTYVTLLKVDPDGTPTVSGDSGNFRTFTANGTLAAWTAAATITTLDDVPPVVGASADGLAQTLAAGSEYVEIPMQTFQAAPTNVLRALRWYFVPWADSGNPASIGFRVHDGTAEYMLLNHVDHGTDNAQTMWVCRMMRTARGSGSTYYLLTQARLDAMAVRVGFSPDATPDVGVHAVFAELAYQPATVFEIFSGEGGAFTVDARLDTVTGGVASWLATVPAGDRGATLSWTIDGASDSHYITPDAGQIVTYEKVVGATSIEQATEVSFTVDPT